MRRASNWRAMTGLIGLRWVTHLDVDEAGIDHAIATVRRFFEAAPAAH